MTPIPDRLQTRGRLRVPRADALVTSHAVGTIVRMRYRNGKLGAPHVVLTGIPWGLHHNGGRVAIGPDRMLYPFKRSRLWSYGHRNVEGLAWDSAGRLWATEGRTSNKRYTSPKAQWRTPAAGPAGIDIIKNVAWIGALTGKRPCRVPLNGAAPAGTPRGFLVGTQGRLRTPSAALDGALWLTTSNTDGRATPRRGDDRILRLKVS